MIGVERMSLPSLVMNDNKENGQLVNAWDKGCSLCHEHTSAR